jgi:hypothetical protein
MEYQNKDRYQTIEINNINQENKINQEPCCFCELFEVLCSFWYCCFI